MEDLIWRRASFSSAFAQYVFRDPYACHSIGSIAVRADLLGERFGEHRAADHDGDRGLCASRRTSAMVSRMKGTVVVISADRPSSLRAGFPHRGEHIGGRHVFTQSPARESRSFAAWWKQCSCRYRARRPPRSPARSSCPAGAQRRAYGRLPRRWRAWRRLPTA